MEIVVDAHDEVERAMAWYYYLDGKFNFPLEVIRVDDNTREAVEDWHYWVNREYQF